LEALNARARYGRDVVQLNVRIPPELKQRLEAVAKGLRIASSDYVEAMLEDVLPASERVLGLRSED
jgi:predicted DNA-binding protein